MKVGVPKETLPGERRVALDPDTVAKLVASGLEVLIEEGAGEAAFFTDSRYEASAARLVDAATLYAEADITLKVQRPSLEEADRLCEGTVLVSSLQPHSNLDLVRKLADRNVTSFSMEAVPRVTKAQSMDALSSMSTIAGYKAVLLAATTHAKLFPMLVTAAGTLAPARALILGAGVAGLQAIATARRLGAIVQAFDVRPATKEQVESLGASFIEAELGQQDTEDKGGYAKELSQDSQTRTLETIRRHLLKVDIVVTTALIPGKPAPLLITEEMVREMKPGSVIVDLAAEAGGNCAVTQAGKEVLHHHITVLGPGNLPSTVPLHASQMYARNISTFLNHLVRDKSINLDFDDVIIRDMCLTHDKQVRHESTRTLLTVQEKPQ